MEEKFKMGLDAQKSFAQMYEDRKMNKRIGGKMMKLDPVIIQEPRKEIKTRKPQSLFKISYVNLLSWKSQLGYGTRDYFYYKKRCGNDSATYEAIDFIRDGDDMVNHNQFEKKIRDVLTTEEQQQQHVPITSLKTLRDNESDDNEDGVNEEEDDHFEINAYKDWLMAQGSSSLKNNSGIVRLTKLLTIVHYLQIYEMISWKKL